MGRLVSFFVIWAPVSYRDAWCRFDFLVARGWQSFVTRRRALMLMMEFYRWKNVVLEGGYQWWQRWLVYENSAMKYYMFSFNKIYRVRESFEVTRVLSPVMAGRVRRDGAYSVANELPIIMAWPSMGNTSSKVGRDKEGTSRVSVSDCVSPSPLSSLYTL